MNASLEHRDCALECSSVEIEIPPNLDEQTPIESDQICILTHLQRHVFEDSQFDDRLFPNLDNIGAYFKLFQHNGDNNISFSPPIEPLSGGTATELLNLLQTVRLSVPSIADYTGYMCA